MMRLWVVGKYFRSIENNVAWDIIGIFDNKQLAIDACGDHVDWFIGPMILNQKLSEKRRTWFGCKYPNFNQVFTKEE